MPNLCITCYALITTPNPWTLIGSTEYIYIYIHAQVQRRNAYPGDHEKGSFPSVLKVMWIVQGSMDKKRTSCHTW